MTEQQDLTGLTYVAGETSPFTGQVIEIVGRDPHVAETADRWMIRAPDGTERSVGGALLRVLVETPDTEEEEEYPPSGAPAAEGTAAPAEAAAEAPPTPATPLLRFEDVPLKIVLCFHARPDGERQVLVGLAQPGQEMLLTSMLEAELGELPPALLHLIGKLEASFPERQAQVAEALKAAAAQAAPPPKPPAGPTKPHQRKPVGKPPAKPQLTQPPARPASPHTPPAAASAAASPVPEGQTSIFDQLALAEATPTNS